MTDAVKAVEAFDSEHEHVTELAADISVPRAITVEVEGPVEETVSSAEAEMVGPPASDLRGHVSTPTRDRQSRAQIKTARLDSRDFRPSWPIAIAALEQLSGWGVLALRLGTLALIQQCVRELAEENARADAVARLRALTDALAHMPLEG